MNKPILHRWIPSDQYGCPIPPMELRAHPRIHLLGYVEGHHLSHLNDGDEKTITTALQGKTSDGRLCTMNTAYTLGEVDSIYLKMYGKHPLIILLDKLPEVEDPALRRRPPVDYSQSSQASHGFRIKFKKAG